MPGGLGRTVTPAAPDAWLTALAEYGTCSLEEALAPALELAEEGFPLGPELRRAIALAAAPAAPSPAGRPRPRPSCRTGACPRWARSSASRSWRGPSGACSTPPPGAGRPQGADRRRARPALPGRDGAGDRRLPPGHGGLLTEDDLAGFRVQIEPPARSAYRGYDVLTCGPWCQGPTLLLALNLLEGFDLPAMGRGSADYLHTVLEALKLAFADRDAYFGDPDFVDVPLDRLLSAEYAAPGGRRLIRPDVAWPGAPPPGNPLRRLAISARQGDRARHVVRLRRRRRRQRLLGDAVRRGGRRGRRPRTGVPHLHPGRPELARSGAPLAASAPGSAPG